MGAKTSAEMLRAIKLVERGATVQSAAHKSGVREGSLYAVLRKSRKNNIVINQQLDTSGIDLGQESEK